MSDGRIEARISVNKLGEYLVATPTRRHRIVIDQKRPRPYVVARYREATEAMVTFLEDGAEDDGIIEAALDELAQKCVTSEFQEQDRDLSMEALESFLNMADSINLEGMVCQRGDADPPRLIISDVSVSVRPDILLSGLNRAGESVAGLLKLYLVKSYPLGNEAGSYIGTVLQQYAAGHLGSLGSVDHRQCLILDVFAQKIHLAPRAYKRRQDDIRAACAEIARAWPYA